MSLYAMSDLHLSHYKDKPMDIFDPVWYNHTEKIYENWNNTVSENDTVIVNGDLSWGINYEEVKPDLEFINSLKGRKIIIQGNHDYFWNSTAKLNTLYENMCFVKNSFEVYEEYGICGTRGWLCPGDTRYTDHDKKIYLREAGRLRLSVEYALKAGYKGENIIGVMHYPPTNDRKEKSLFTSIFEEYGIKRVIYGHLHGVSKYNNSLEGEVNGIVYSLVSADYLKFKPLKIM